MASTPQDFTSGLVLTDTIMDKLPQGILGITTATSGSASTSGTTSLDVLTAPAVTPAQASRRLRIRFQWRSVTGTVANDIYVVRIQEGATVLNEQEFLLPVISVGIEGSSLEAIVDSPSLAAHTYKATLTRASGTGTAAIGAAATFPMMIYVEDVGSA